MLLEISKGSETAFRKIYDFYSNRIYNYAFKIIQKDIMAEEILQDVFIKVWLGRTSLPQILHFDAWLYTIARNYTFNALKKEAYHNRFANIENENYEAQEFTAEEKLYFKQYKEELNKLVNQLSAQQKKVFILSKDEGLKRDEIAKHLHIAPETVKYHLAEAMRFIRSNMSNENIIIFLLYTGSIVFIK